MGERISQVTRQVQTRISVVSEGDLPLASMCWRKGGVERDQTSALDLNEVKAETRLCRRHRSFR